MFVLSELISGMQEIFAGGAPGMPVPVMNVVPVPVRQNFAKNYIKKVKKSKFFACGAYRHHSRLIKDLKNGPKK